MKAIQLNAFLTTSESGRKWTKSKHFRPCLHLYLELSTCDRIDKMYLKNRACLVFFQCQVIVSHPGLNTKNGPGRM